MKFSAVASLAKRGKSDLIALPFWKEEKGVKAAAALGTLKEEVDLALSSGDFHGKLGEVLTLYPNGEAEKRLVLLGLGEKKETSLEKMRRAYCALTKRCNSLKVESITVLPPEVKELPSGELSAAIAEGIALSNYRFEELKTFKDKETHAVLLKKVAFVGFSKKELAEANSAAACSEGVHFARNLVNRNADTVTPKYLGEQAKALAKKYSAVKATVFDKKRIEKEKMELLLAVNRGSSNDPAFIILEYKGNPRSKDHTVVVGKGVTYDTGGLNLKPTGYMETMKSDMSGAAAALGVIEAVAAIGLKKNVTAVIPTTENSIGGKSYKPGDVYGSYLGKTVEIGNTDAEGRLILADALAYASKKLKPTRMIDFATLTGAIVIALGEDASGLMSNNDALAKELIHAGEKTYERVWRMPLFEEYKEQLKSHVADIKNVGGRAAGSITAALFLQEFVGEDIPWAHLDIAGTAFLDHKAKHYNPKHATGVGVRLMIQFLKDL